MHVSNDWVIKKGDNYQSCYRPQHYSNRGGRSRTASQIARFIGADSPRSASRKRPPSKRMGYQYKRLRGQPGPMIAIWKKNLNWTFPSWSKEKFNKVVNFVFYINFYQKLWNRIYNKRNMFPVIENFLPGCWKFHLNKNY